MAKFHGWWWGSSSSSGNTWSRFGDKIYGTGAGEELTGTERNDIIYARGGDDTIHPGAGRDFADGGEGNDTAVFSGNVDDHDISFSWGGWVSVTGASGERDWLKRVEILEFDDSIVTLANGSYTVTKKEPNDPPTAITLDPADVTVTENETGVIIGALTVTDPDDATHTFTTDDNRFEVVGGELKLKADASLDYETEPTANVAVTARDSRGQTFTETFAITVTNVNDAPIASTVDLGAIAEDTSRTIAAAELLGGVTDDDGPSLSITELSIQSGNGTLTPNTDGTWTYTTAPDDDSDVVFAYTASDGTSVASATATLDITPVQDYGDGNDRVFTGPSNDIVSTKGGHDWIWTDGGNDTVDAGSGWDWVFAGRGDDTVTPGSGNDFVDGGWGTDTVVLSGNFAEYNIHSGWWGWVKVTNNDTGERDWLTRVEVLEFDDGFYYLDGRDDPFEPKEPAGPDFVLPETFVVIEDQPSLVTDPEGNPAAITGVDTAAQLALIVTAPNGLLSTGVVGSAPVQQVSYSGTAAEINAQLANLSYTPDANYNGAEALTFELFDANTGVDLASATVPTTITPVNDDPNGLPVISDTTPTAGQEISADLSGISDVDGISGDFSYQWERFDSGEWFEIPGAMGSVLSNTEDYIGQQLRVVVSYTDDDGTLETLTSEATEAVQDDQEPFVIGNILLSDIAADTSGAGGFKILAPQTDDLQPPFSIDGVGDVNGDGIDDILIGARGDGTNGAAYVVYGSETPPTTIQLSEIAQDTNTGGFKIIGEAEDDDAGIGVALIGDVNGDGRADLLIGSNNEEGGTTAGATYVVYGGSFTDEINLIEVAAAGSTVGFKIIGEEGSASGVSVESAGDVNKDGIDDLIIGAYGADEGRGGAYVVYGGLNNGTVDLSEIADGTNSNGFKILGPDPVTYAGLDVSSAGDINNDGYDDVILGAYLSGSEGGTLNGAAYVVFGGEGVGTVDLTNLGADEGFQIAGGTNEALGYTVQAAGDVNDDGIDDIIISAYFYDEGRGKAYVLYGSETFASTIQAPDITDGTTPLGFAIIGEAQGDAAAYDVSAAGDINGDGIGDLLVGAVNNDAGGTGAGAAYVVYGGHGQTEIDLADIANGNNDLGFKITGEVAGDNAGALVSAGGDINNDGYDDLLIAAPNADNGTIEDAGAVYVIYGGPANASAPTTPGSVFDFYVAGGTVYADTDGSGALDGTEVSDTTDGFGGFDLPEGSTGTLILEGGIDVGTLLPFTGQLRAPEGSTVITPMTTLIVAATELDPDVSADQVAQTLATGLQSLGVPSNYDFFNTDPIAALLAGENGAAAVITFMSAIQDLVVVVGATIDALPVEGTRMMSGAEAMMQVLAGELVDPGNIGNREEQIQAAAELAGVSTAHAAEFASSGIEDILDDLSQAALTLHIAHGLTGIALLEGLARVAVVARGDAAEQVADAARILAETGDPGALNAAIARYTGEPLTSEISNAEIGDVDGGIGIDDSTTTDKETPITINVIDNDIDEVGGNLFVESFGAASNGSVSDDGVGNLIYTPAENFVGTDSFTYVVSNGLGESDEATVTVRVLDTTGNKPPTAGEDDASGPEGTTIVVNVLENDNDPEGDLDPTSVQIDGADPGTDGKFKQTGEGIWSVRTDGVIEFKPHAGFTGTVEPITYTVADVEGNRSNPAPVHVTVTDGTNLPPTADGDSASGPQGTLISIDVLANDDDPEGDLDPTSVEIDDADDGSSGKMKSTGEGIWSVSEDGFIVFAPEAGFTGTVEPITYTVADAEGNRSGPAPVHVTVTIDGGVNEAPFAGDDSASGPADTPVFVDVLQNDSDNDGSIDPASIQIVDGDDPLGRNKTVFGEGRWTANPDGTIDFKPDPDFTGEATPIMYTVADNEGLRSNEATVTVTIDGGTANIAPEIPEGQSFFVAEESALGTTIGGVDATDPDDGPDALKYFITNGDTALFELNAATGQLTLAGSVDDPEIGAHVLEITVDDGKDTTVETVTVNVTAVNDAPTGAPELGLVVPVVGATLTVDIGNIDDADGLPEAQEFTYQWEVSDDGTVWNAIDGANEPTYTLTEDLEGKQVRVSVNYTDQQGFTDNLTSSTPTDAVTSLATVASVVLVGNAVVADELGSQVGELIALDENGNFLDGVTFTVDDERFTVNDGILEVAAEAAAFGTNQILIALSVAALHKANQINENIVLTLLDGSGTGYTNDNALYETDAPAIDFNGDGITDALLRGSAAISFGSVAGLVAASTAEIIDAGGAAGIVFDVEADALTGADFNNDGVDDIAVANVADSKAYIVFGSDLGFSSATISTAALDGTTGVTITGLTDVQIGGTGSVAATTGDVNGDGIDDLIVNQFLTDATGTESTSLVHVIYGSEAGFASEINVGDFDGTNGFTLDATVGALAGSSLAVEDIDGDEIDDIVVSATSTEFDGTGSIYVVRGRDDFAAQTSLTALTAPQMILIENTAASTFGSSVRSVGDMTGDGIAELAVTDAAGNVYLLDGQVMLDEAQSAEAILDVTEADITFNGGGGSVSRAGDINGDGLEDIFVTDETGTTFAIHGRSDLLLASEPLELLEAAKQDGFAIAGTAGAPLRLGDANGDGFEDFLVVRDGGVRFTSGNDFSEEAAFVAGDGQFDFDGTSLSAFEAHVIIGDENANVLIGSGGNDRILAGAGGDTLNGGAGNDGLEAGGGDDNLFGGVGNDLLLGDFGNDRLDGGPGMDRAEGGPGADTFVFNQGDGQLLIRDFHSGIDKLELSGFTGGPEPLSFAILDRNGDGVLTPADEGIDVAPHGNGLTIGFGPDPDAPVDVITILHVQALTPADLLFTV